MNLGGSCEGVKALGRDLGCDLVGHSMILCLAQALSGNQAVKEQGANAYDETAYIDSTLKGDELGKRMIRSRTMLAASVVIIFTIFHPVMGQRPDARASERECERDLNERELEERVLRLRCLSIRARNSNRSDKTRSSP